MPHPGQPVILNLLFSIYNLLLNQIKESARSCHIIKIKFNLKKKAKNVLVNITFERQLDASPDRAQKLG